MTLSICHYAMPERRVQVGLENCGSGDPGPAVSQRGTAQQASETSPNRIVPNQLPRRPARFGDRHGPKIVPFGRPRDSSLPILGRFAIIAPFRKV